MSTATVHRGAPPAVSSPVSPAELRSAFRRAAASAWVVTGARAPGLDPVGFTAVSVVSVSLEPPLVSFNVTKTSSSLVTLGRTRRAALHLLADDQDEVAIRFAADRSRRFVDDGVWGWAGGLPDVHGAALRLTTTVVDLVDAGDSFLALARVERASGGDAAYPLVHHAGHFGPLAQIGA